VTVEPESQSSTSRVVALVDNNYAQREPMRAFLAASPNHFAVIPHTLLQEWHKRSAAVTIRQHLQIACAFPSQILILKDTIDLLHLSGRAEGLLMRLIDRRQTRDFAAYCETVITTPLTAAIEEQFAAHEQYTGETMQALTLEAHKMMALFAKWDDPNYADGFTRQELRDLMGAVDRGTPLTTELQQKTFRKAIEQAASQFRAHGVDASKIPQDFSELANLLGFRFGAMMVGLYVMWRNKPGTYPSGDKQALNWLNDLKFAAQATYFDDFRTHEVKRLLPVYQIGMSLITALGGYTNCGRYETLAQKLAQIG
jgi:hypothetical protein